MFEKAIGAVVNFVKNPKVLKIAGTVTMVAIPLLTMANDNINAEKAINAAEERAEETATRLFNEYVESRES